MSFPKVHNAKPENVAGHSKTKVQILMVQLKRYIMKNSKPLLVYFSLAYFFSWIVFILLALNHQKIIFLFSESKANERLADIWHSFGALGPFLSAVITLRYFYAKNQWRQFIKGYSVNKINYSGFFLLYFMVFLRKPAGGVLPCLHYKREIQQLYQQ